MGLSRVQTFSTPIKDQNGQYGILMVELNGRDEMQEWQQRLLETVASHVALAINMAQQVSQTRLVSLLEERSAIARELHDSLAQSLSYLKIQVSRLEKAVIESEDQSQILDISKVLRSALNGAYRQLRDLLTTFRLSINDADFCMTLQETVEEFSKKGNFTIAFEHHLANCRLSPNAEIHLLQIIREALSNVMRHANATHAGLSIECDQNGQVMLLIEDDGSGLVEQHDMMQHYGLPIMKERAEWLGGSLEIDDAEGQGTRVRLTFSSTESEHTLQHQTLMQKLADV
jgi:two-component system nitrate/nitrite sensor histidine kinase NarX